MPKKCYFNFEKKNGGLRAFRKTEFWIFAFPYVRVA